MRRIKKYSSWPVAAAFIGALFGFISHRWDVFILMFTAVILVWYSVETQRLRVLSVTPGLTLRWIWRNENQNWLLHISNQGKGTALNPNVIFSKGEYNFKHFKEINAISEKDGVDVQLVKHGATLNTEELQALGASPLTVTIYFNSIEGRLSRTTVEIKNPPTATITGTDWL